MQNYFESEITYLEKELRHLKTSSTKSGAVVTSQVQTVQYNIPLTLTSSTNATGNQLYKLLVNDDSIVEASLNVYYDDIVEARGDTRRRTVETYWLDENTFIIKVSAWGNSNDRQVLEDGGTVTISGDLTVTCTDSFKLEAL